VAERKNVTANKITATKNGTYSTMMMTTYGTLSGVLSATVRTYATTVYVTNAAVDTQRATRETNTPKSASDSQTQTHTNYRTLNTPYSCLLI
jgi:hypothetical protein